MWLNRDVSWWYWMVMDLLLIGGLAGWPWGFAPVIALGMVQAAHYRIRERSLTAFPVQVRLAYLGLLVLGQWAPLHFIYWIQVAGTTAMVLAGYCPLARFLSLMPWNRTQALSWRLVYRTFMSAPVKGNVLQPRTVLSSLFAVAAALTVPASAEALPIGGDGGGGGGGGSDGGGGSLTCLNNVTGSLWASPQSVQAGQSTTLSWGVSSGGCPITLRIAWNPGDVPVSGNSGSLTVQPVFNVNGHATYNLVAYYNGSVKSLDAADVYELTPTVLGRKQVKIVGSTSADVTKFVNAIATPNTTILLGDDVNLDLSGLANLPIAYGVHIIGGRSSTKPGPRLFTTKIRTEGPEPLFSIAQYHDDDAVRISGVRIDGGDMGIAGNPVIQDDDEVTPIGIRISAVNVEIGNCEIYGWSDIAVQVMDLRGRVSVKNPSAVWIHDNYIHHNQRYRHEGYGVQTQEGAHALIERNVFNYNRHSLESTGFGDTGYRAYNNLLLTGGGVNSAETFTHVFDVHGTQSCGFKDAYCGRAGEYYDYRYNTLFYVNGDVIKVRGEPSIGADVTGNVFAKDEGSSAVSQTAGTNLSAWNNTFNAIESFRAWACDFDGDGQADDFMATGANWWYKSAATGYQFYYLATSAKMAGQLTFSDVNGDGRCDVTDPATGTVYLNRRATGGSATAVLVAPQQRTDLVWAQPNAQGSIESAQVWQLNPALSAVANEVTVPLQEAGFPAGGSQILATGDFNADGAADLLWRTGGFAFVTLLDADGRNVVAPAHLARSLAYHVNDALVLGAIPTSDSGEVAEFAGLGDFNGDNRSDVLWRKPNGQLVVWFAGMPFNRALLNYNNDINVDPNGLGSPIEAPIALNWHVKGVADFNGDGYSDILWRSDDNQASIWYMVHGVHVGDYITQIQEDGWEIQGIGDFAGDGKADILWRHADGRLSMWTDGHNNGAANPSPAWNNLPYVVIGQEWQVEAIADFNADGKADILWRDTNDGTVVIWKMNGASYTGSSALLATDTTMQLWATLAQAPQRIDLQ